MHHDPLITDLNGSGALEHFDSYFQVIASFLDALQKNFKEDTHYAYPLMPPQANTLYVLDGEVAGNMKKHMMQLMQATCGLTEKDFRFCDRLPQEDGGLYRIRLEFTEGITFDLIRTLLESTTKLEERVLQRKLAQ